ncbi:MAG TPA: ornithine cyclodeaminase family protein [Methylomirabilota bacterium]|nr:ornithine cyclodeaminase family protein [Methylomirabilota bacterium]
MTATLLLSGADVAALLTPAECAAAVARAFALHAAGDSLPPGVLGVHAGDGGFHVKTAGLRAPRPCFAAKVNANFPGNPARFGLPAIQGVVVLCDAGNGALLAVLDSAELTALRTAATTALAATHLAPPHARVATVVGCGVQGGAHVRALAAVLPLERIHAVDADPARAAALATALTRETGREVRATAELGAALADSQVCVTCTPSRRPLLHAGDVRPGTFVAAVGADSEDKQEIDPALLAASAVVVDHLGQCATIGDLHHALAGGFVTPEHVRAELWEVVTGRRRGRLADDEVVVFDSTGTALQDVAAAMAVYDKAIAAGRGRAVELR